MPEIDRNNFSDAKKYIRPLFSTHGQLHLISSFLYEQIILANEIDPYNWNLNFDLNAKFLRFNVGQEYCIEIQQSEILVLCLKDDLPRECQKKQKDFFFRGYKKDVGIINTENIDEASQCLARVPDSIGVVFKKNIVDWLPFVSESNARFIKYSISKTKILPQMIEAHSVGAVEYLSEIIGKDIPNPLFVSRSIMINEERVLKKTKKMSDEELAQKAKSYDAKPQKVKTSTSVFVRSPYVVEQAKRIAQGKCQDCGNCAPFKKKGTDEPFWEIHHILPLSQGGTDTIENVVALCPNCHRKRHYG